MKECGKTLRNTIARREKNKGGERNYEKKKKYRERLQRSSQIRNTKPITQ